MYWFEVFHHVPLPILETHSTKFWCCSRLYH